MLRSVHRYVLWSTLYGSGYYPAEKNWTLLKKHLVLICLLPTSLIVLQYSAVSPLCRPEPEPELGYWKCALSTLAILRSLILDDVGFASPLTDSVSQSHYRTDFLVQR